MNKATHLGLSAVLDENVTPHARDFKRAYEIAKNEFQYLKELNCIWLDDNACPLKAVRVANEFLSEGVKIVIGHYSSDAAKAALPVYEKGGCYLISPAATERTIGEGYNSFFRTCPNDDDLANALVNNIANKECKNILLKHDGTVHGVGLFNAIHEKLQKKSIDVNTESIVDAHIFCGRLKSSKKYLKECKFSGPIYLTDDANDMSIYSVLKAKHEVYIVGFDKIVEDDQITKWVEAYKIIFNVFPSTYFVSAMIAFKVAEYLYLKGNLKNNHLIIKKPFAVFHNGNILNPIVSVCKLEK